MKFRAEPTRTACFIPGRQQAVMVRAGHKNRLIEPAEFLRVNSVEQAPMENFNEHFLETMRMKGWLRK